MKTLTIELGNRLAEEAARRFGKSGDRADVYQAAWVAMLVAAPKYRPRRGAGGLAGFLAVAIRNHLVDGFRRRSKDARQPLTFEPTAPGTPEQEVCTERWVVRWVERYQRCLDGTSQAVVQAVICEEEPPAEVAERLDLPVENVYQAVRNARKRASRDPVLREMLSELEDFGRAA